MEIVEKGTMAPGLCLFTGDIDGPFLDLKRWVSYVDPYAYVHVPFVKEMGRAVGMIEPEEFADALAQLAEAKAELAEVKAELAEARTVAEAVEIVQRVAA